MISKKKEKKSIQLEFERKIEHRCCAFQIKYAFSPIMHFFAAKMQKKKFFKYLRGNTIKLLFIVLLFMHIISSP